MKTSLVTNKLNTHIITTTKMKLLTLLMVLLSSWGWGQTNPGSIFDLSSGNWSFSGWSSSVGAGKYPTNGATGSDATTGVSSSATDSHVIFWKHGTGDPLITTAASANYSSAYTSANATIYGNGTNGIGFNGTSNAGIGSVVLSINTTGRQDIQVTWTGRTIATGLRTYGIRLMYRIGTTGSFIDASSTVSNIFYAAAASVGSTVKPTITLPSTVNNAGTVQLMWYYYNEATTTSGSRPTLGLDDISVTSTAAPPCSGTPAPGNTLATVNPVTGGSSTILSLQNATAGSGVTYQWKSSTDNVTFTNISGATSATYTATPSAATYYVCDVTCSGVTTSSNSIQVALTYCTPTSSSSSTYFSGFTTTGGSTNISNNSTAFSSGGYVNYSSSMAVSQFATGTVNFSATIVGGTAGIAIFVDYNNDFDFIDAGETVYNSAAFQSTGTTSSSFVIPSGTALGNYRMRIVTDYNIGSPTSCAFASGSRGEVEDYTLTVVAQPTCMVPTALTSSAISYQTATIGWTAPTLGTAPANYEYEVRTSGAAGSGATGLVTSGTVSTNSANVTGLTGATTYSYYLRSSCGNNDFSIWTNAGTFTTLSCSVPTGVTSSALTYTSATIGWTAPATGSPAGYEYEIRTSGSAGSGTTGLVTSGTITGSTVSASITGLTAGTTYSVYVRSNCYTGFNSAWTSAASFSTIKIEPTNQVTALSAGTVTASAIPLSWTAAATGSQAPDGYLVKASDIDLTSIIDPVDGNDPTNVTAFTTNAANKKQTTGTATSTTSFTSMLAGSMYYYKVYSYTNTGTAIDFNTTLPATLAHATTPNTVSSTLTAETITLNSIGFSWSSTAYLSGSNEYLIFAKAGSAVTSGTPVLNPTTYTASSTFGSGTAYEADASAFCVYKGDGTSINLTGLSASTTYHFLIYAVVSNANSNGSFSFATGTSVNRTTTCGVISTFPWTEGFESITSVSTTTFPNCWLEGNGTNWNSLSNSTTVYNDARTGSKYIGCYYSSASSHRLWTPGFQLTAGVSYDFSTYFVGDGYSGWTGEIVYNTTASATGETTMGASIITSSTTSTSGTNYAQITRTFVPSVTGVYYFGIKVTATGVPYGYLGFDDFKLEVTPTCFPATALTSSSITNQTASIGWTAPANGTSPAGYQYEVRTSGAAGSGATGLVASGSTTAPTVSASLTGLNSGTTYFYYVRSNCGGGDFSSWSNATFSTLCDAITNFPYTENFDGVTAPALPNCWSVLDVNADGDKWITYTGYSQSGNNSVGLYTDYNAGANNDFLISPQFNLSGIKRLKYSVRARSSSEPNDYRVLLSTTGSSASDFSTVLLPLTSVSSTSYSQVIIDLSMYSGNVYIAFNVPAGGLDGYYIYIDDVVIEETPLITWTGTTSTSWSTASNWNPAAVPSSTNNVTIPTTGITNFPVTTSLTIAAGATLTLNGNARLTVNGTLTNNGTLTLESGATLVQDGSGTVAGSGTFNVKQALTGAGGATPSGRFWYLGSPVSGATSTVFNAAGDNRLWTFAEATQSYTEITTNGVSMSPMQGHVARLGANETSIFTGGLLNTGNYTNSSLTNTGTGSTRGYTLLSNPYPSYLDWTAAYTAAVATNVNLSSSIWYRSNDGTNMVYDIYNATGAIATNNSGGTTTQYIPPMQAFWVYNPNDGTTGSVTFSNSMRSHQNNGGLKSITDFPAFVRLNLENDGAIDQTVLYFDNNAAAGYDNFDSDKMMVSNAAQVYSFVDNKKLAINGMKSVKTNKQVPLTVEFPTAKGYSFNATEVVMTDGIVILEDRLTKVFQDLTMNPVYAFDAVAGTDANRFVVHFQANSGVAGIETAEDNGIAIVSNASGLVTITLSEELPAMGTIQIIDINGKVIATQAINEQTTTMNINAATGVYHVLVDSSAKVARKKIVITK
jgi:hypothetical protein